MGVHAGRESLEVLEVERDPARAHAKWFVWALAPCDLSRVCRCPVYTEHSLLLGRRVSCKPYLILKPYGFSLYRTPTR